jgi:hypothetical protein
MTNRRQFVVQLSVVGGSAAVGHRAFAQAGPPLPETDPQAVALGYKTDTTKVDAKKYPKHENSQMCGNCSLFQGKPTDAMGGCTLFAGKQVAAKGWCSAWVKKA